MKVLICVDFSAHTERILQAAQNVLGTRVPQPEVTVLHVIDEVLIISGTGNEQNVYKEMQENSRQINQMAKKYLGAGTKYIEESGVPEVKIDNALKEVEYDLLVFGTKGRSALANILLGSEAQHLMRHAEKPMLIVP